MKVTEEKKAVEVAEDVQSGPAVEAVEEITEAPAIVDTEAPAEANVVVEASEKSSSTEGAVKTDSDDAAVDTGVKSDEPKGESKVDPHASREADKYENPIPSREFIIEVLEKADRPLRIKQVAQELNVEDDERFEAVSRRLKAMVRDGQIIRNRRGCFAVMSEAEMIAGTVIGHPGGFGFVKPTEDEGGDLFLSDREMHKVFHGDKVIASVIGLDRRGRREGMVVEVTERNSDIVMGRLQYENGLAWVQPNNNKIAQDVFIPSDGIAQANEGQVVLVKIIHHASKRFSAIGQVVDVVGDYMAPGMEIESAIHAYGIPNTWNDELNAELDAIPNEIVEADFEGRKDLRALDLVTIDGADSKDFDDAVYAKRRKNGGWRLVVAIADVSHYVKPGSPLDKEAFERGTSVYFPQRVVPMLPEKLSNGLCSLNPHVDRLCMVSDMMIDGNGALESSKYYQAVMNSSARLTYNEVHDVLHNEGSEHKERLADLLPGLEVLNELYGSLKEARALRGALEFETTETTIVFDDERKIEKIIPVTRNEAHKIIEECMLMANVATARYLKYHKVPMLYRVHETPTEMKLESLRTFLGDFSIVLGGGDEPTGHDFAAVAAQAKGQDYEKLVQTVLLRSMKQAVYQPENKGHFGLNYDLYAHFTSPIRRYPDLMIHRAIRHVWSKKPVEKFAYQATEMPNIGQHCSDMERRADEATRDSVTFLKCEYLSHRLGDEYVATVTAATNFGLFVELDDLYVEGLVHITELGEDYFHYDNARHCLKGERTGKVYRLGDKVHVQVAQVNLDDRKVDLKFVQNDEKDVLTETQKADIADAEEGMLSSDVDGNTGTVATEEEAPKRRHQRKGRGRHPRHRNRTKKPTESNSDNV